MKGIYLIRNIVNDKSYIGKSKNINKRIREHKNWSNNPNRKEYNYPLYKDMRIYGLDKFEFKVLELTEDLNSRELYYFEKYKPEYCTIRPDESPLENETVKNKYLKDNLHIMNNNLEKGKFNKVKIVAINLQTKEELIFNSMLEAELTIGVHRSSISAILNSNNKRTKSKGYTFRRF